MTAPKGPPTLGLAPSVRTLAECNPGEVVSLLHNGERVTVEVATRCRVRIRPVERDERSFTDGEGVVHTIRVRRPARDVAPTVRVTP